MRDRNEWRVTGRLGRDPVRFEKNKVRVEFPVAINEDYFTASGDKKERTTWATVVTFDATADFCYEHLSKGSWVDVTGRLDMRTHDRDGQERLSIKLEAREVLSPPESRRTRDVSSDKPSPIGSFGPDGGPKSAEPNFDDVIPFG